MRQLAGIDLSDVQAVYSGPEADLWELLMGEQIHIGGLSSSADLAERAEIHAGMRGIDLCCCTGAGMRYLVRFHGVAKMVGVDATPRSIVRGRQRCHDEGLGERIEFVLADATATGLPDESADFVWGEDAWCYVVDKPRLIAEAARLAKRGGGIIAFTDWVEGDTPLTYPESERFMRFMKFGSLETREGYVGLLKRVGCTIVAAEDTRRFAPCIELYLKMVGTQLTYDVMKIVGFDRKVVNHIANEMQFIQELAQSGKVIQALFVARRS